MGISIIVLMDRIGCSHCSGRNRVGGNGKTKTVFQASAMQMIRTKTGPVVCSLRSCWTVWLFVFNILTRKGTAVYHGVIEGGRNRVAGGAKPRHQGRTSQTTSTSASAVATTTRFWRTVGLLIFIICIDEFFVFIIIIDTT